MSHLLELLFNTEYSDATLVASCGTEIPVHKNVLCLQCPTFKAMYDDKWKQPGQVPRATLDYDLQTVRHILFYFYIGRLYDTRHCVRSRAIWATAADDTRPSDVARADPRDSLTCLNDDPVRIVNVYRLADYLGFARLQKTIMAFLQGKIGQLSQDAEVFAGLLREAYADVDFPHDQVVIDVLQGQVERCLAAGGVDELVAKVLDENVGTEWRATRMLPKRQREETPVVASGNSMTVVERPKVSE